MAPTHVLIQITDLHLLDEHESARGGVDTFAVLERALAVVAAAEPVAALLFTGDLADRGSPLAYRRLRAAVRESGVDAPVIYVPGNHDDREAMRAELLDELPNIQPIDQVRMLGELRIVALDSTVRGSGHGELTERQLDWLRDQLATPAPAGSVLVLHHPPLPSPLAQTRRYELRDRAALGEAIAGTDVRFVMGGHTHVTSAGTLAGVPVWAGGPISTTLDSLPAPGGTRTFTTPSISRIDVYADTVMASAVPVVVTP